MEYFNIKGKSFSIDREKLIRMSKGTRSVIYYYGKDECIKFFDGKSGVKRPDVLEDIKRLHLHHFDSLKEILYDEDGTLKCYIMRKYAPYIGDVYSMEIEEFRKLFQTLLGDFNKLSANGIMAVNLDHHNILSSHGKLKIYNYDEFERRKRGIVNKNNRALIAFLQDVFLTQRITNGYQEELPQLDVFDFFDVSNKPETILDRLDGKRFVYDCIKR